MARTSKLTSVEKYTIQGALHNNITVEKICDMIDRPIHVVQKYVDGELKSIQETIAKVQADKVKDEQPKNLKAKDLFTHITKSGKKEKGVTIMTEAASQKGDSASERNRKLANRHMSKNIYRLSDGKILENGDSIKEE